MTPFHLGPAALVGVVLYRRLDLPTLLAASVIVDVRAALVLFGPLDPPVHGILTTFLGGGAVALVLAGGVLALPPPVQTRLDRARIASTASAGPVVAGSLVGVWSHVVLDAVLYTDARPLFPLAGNPLLGQQYGLVYGGCLAAGVLAVVGYAAVVHPRAGSTG